MGSFQKSNFATKFRETDTHVYFHGGLLSNWHIGERFKVYLPIVVNDANGRRITKSKEMVELNCGEQGMMASKASIFGDQKRLQDILKTSSPKMQKDLGQLVKPYSDPVWSRLRKTAVTLISFSRAAQDKQVLDYIMSTGSKRLVEGSPSDTIWGVGLGFNNPLIDDERNWRGTNLLGDSWQDVRDLMNEFGPEADAWVVVSQLAKLREATSPKP